MTTGCTTTNYYVRTYDTNTFSYSMYDPAFTNVNFRYIVRLYKGITLLSTLKFTSDSTGYAYFNPTDYISNFLTSDIDITTNTLKTCPNSYGEYTLKFSMEYGDPVVEYTGSTQNTRFYYNGCQIYEGYDYIYGNNYWVAMTGSTSGHFLSPVYDFFLDPTENLWLYFINKNLPSCYAVYEFYKNNSVTETDAYHLTLTANTMVSIGAGPNNIPTGHTNSYDYYKVYIQAIGIDPYISGYTVYNTSKCNKYDYTSLYWLNEHGGWSNFLFNKKRIVTSKINRDIYDKFLSYGYSTNVALNTVRGLVNHRNIIDEEILLQTDNINDEQSTLIKDLLYSTDVRVLTTLPNGVQKLIPCIVLDNDFTERTKVNDKVFSYSIKIKMSTQKIVQHQ